MSSIVEKLSGKFISFEGIEGAGKTTLIKNLADKIKATGLDVVITREPGGTEVGEEIREVLLKHRDVELFSDTELLLFAAGRSQHVAQKIKPALAKGSCVLCDRFADASSAYQGAGRGISSRRLKQLEDWVLQGFLPDIVVIMDISVKSGFARAKGRGQLDRIESQEESFFERIREFYLEKARQEPKRYLVIDAEKSIDDIVRFFWENISNYVK